MSTLRFADTHNLVMFLSKPAECEGFKKIMDFLNAHIIKYALTVNLTTYTSCIEQFWSTVKAKTVNREIQLQALVDGKKIVVTKASIRRDLQLEDAKCVDCLPNATIFEQLTLMGKFHDEDELWIMIYLDLIVLVKILDVSRFVAMLELFSSEDEGLGEEDASKQGRKIHDIDADEDITLENVHDEDMFDTVVFNDEEVFAGQDMAEKEVSTANPVTTAGEVVTTANVEVSTASPTAATITTVELTLAQTLAELKSARPKTKVLVVHDQEPSESITTTTTIPSKDKGKGIMVEEPLKMKKKDQDKVETNYELAQRLQAEEQEELTIEEKSKLFVQLLEARKKHFSAKRAEEKRNMPPIRVQ
ncbi:hypothetical protein Tco_0729975 [Tanacetum coccineum]|uniref:Xylulose kinase-1 n=1 Tax=Tanacetum coccineum TaxID=301880 RepID=A0ABQ4YQF6_9ASTR